MALFETHALNHCRNSANHAARYLKRTFRFCVRATTFGREATVSRKLNERLLSTRADIERIVQCDRPGLRIGLCENCVTECCAVVQGTAIAMGAVPFSIN